ncbi:maleylpyruvate isomerase N-terminal domain-containing protein [Kineococcus gynurae]|uniref:Maleylpyruvate isomerase N-terminal domain-containing protein n=1 Tax=Kineococcus gynurae TaxID=452979 RepID=A0ABV5LSV9_9ACTN
MTGAPAVGRLGIDHAEALAALVASIDDLLGTAAAFGATDWSAATRCRGWTVADVHAHLDLGLQELLHGLLRPTDRPPTHDAAGYWRAFAAAGGGGDGNGAAHARFVRRLADAYVDPAGLLAHLTATATAARDGARRLPSGAVEMQGMVLATGDLFTTWAVELAVHRLDLTRELDLPAAPAAALGLARRTVEVLSGLDPSLLAPLDDATVVLVGAGRIDPTTVDAPAALAAVLG